MRTILNKLSVCDNTGDFKLGRAILVAFLLLAFFAASMYVLIASI